ncbi:MAG: bifunctional diaminohydroxyphosphoribosylaminopyrimidine deaminase/5-amino-6-(5-phosphoribosylamino)uracil reductase RibD [Luteolibacter sp.]
MMTRALGNKIYANRRLAVTDPDWTCCECIYIFRKMTDEEWMAKALAEARKGIGKTAPNPPVGAVMVKDGELLGAGWHHGAGLPHAEVEAISAAIAKHGEGCLKGATAYVTLEPCSTTGRTPACTDGLIAAGISRVVYACQDPNPLHAGAADDVLEKAGIEVQAGVLEDSCGEILRPFSKVQRTGLPWVIWKCAMSLDGKITRPEGEGQWLSGEESRADVQRLRADVDAIMTSGETVRADKPALTIRVPELLEGRNQPWRVVITDKKETMPVEAALFSDGWRARTLVRSGVDLDMVLRNLVREQGVLSVMIEAGGNFSAAMIAAGFVDEAVIYQAPMLCGATVPALQGKGFAQSVRLAGMTYERIGNDTKIRGLLVK